MRGYDHMSASSKKKLRKEQEAAKLTEKQQAAQQEAKKNRLYTSLFVVACSSPFLAFFSSWSISACGSVFNLDVFTPQISTFPCMEYLLWKFGYKQYFPMGPDDTQKMVWRFFTNFRDEKIEGTVFDSQIDSTFQLFHEFLTGKTRKGALT